MIAKRHTVQMLIESQLLQLGKRQLCLAGRAEEDNSAEKMLLEAITSKRALEKLRIMIAAQGGDAAVCDDPSRLPQAKKVIPILSQSAGYLAETDAQSIGMCAQLLGAGRAELGDCVDPAVGLVMENAWGTLCAVGMFWQNFM